MRRLRESPGIFVGRSTAPAPSWRGVAIAALILLAVIATATVILIRLAAVRSRAGRDAEPPPPPPRAKVTWPLSRMVMPTPQAALLDSPPEAVLQPTASGRPESALFGSVRTANVGRSVLPSFHEGVDIAATSRDRSGRALDPVFAVADGRVAYVSRSAGDSNYGIYVVLLHPDAIGEVYTLYAHLAEAEKSLRADLPVTAGTVLGRMGNTPSSIVPVARAHLHVEIGLLANTRFDRWLSGQGTRSPHGIYNGWNLLGFDPLAVMRDSRREGKSFSLLEHVKSQSPAFELVVRASRLPNFFQRHSVLWTGADFQGPALVLACSEGGTPLAGRPATPEEAALLKGRPAAVLKVDKDVLGRNGKRLIVDRSSSWELGSAGERWLQILLY